MNVDDNTCIKYTIKRHGDDDAVEIFTLSEIERGNAMGFMYKHREEGYGYETVKSFMLNMANYTDEELLDMKSIIDDEISERGI